MEDERRRKKMKKAAVIVLIVIAALVYGAVSDHQEKEIGLERGSEEAAAADQKLPDSGEGDSGSADGDEAAGGTETKEIYVDVGGAVTHPGVVSIAEGSRVFEAVEAAGGTTSEAETKYINMASECTDGQKLYIPTAAEAEEAVLGGGGEGELFSADPSGLLTGGDSGEKKVNINTATSEELQTLDGIGPSMAQRIIEYRQTNGKFEAVEDLTDVSGIGEKTLEKLLPDVCV